MSRRRRRHAKTPAKGKTTNQKTTSIKPKAVQIKRIAVVSKRQPIVRKTRRKTKVVVKKTKNVKPPPSKTTTKSKLKNAGETVTPEEIKEEIEQDALEQVPMKEEVTEVKSEECLPNDNQISIVPEIQIETIRPDEMKQKDTDVQEQNSQSEEELEIVEVENDPQAMETLPTNQVSTPEASGISCLVCKKDFDSPAALAQHIKEHSSCNQVHKCSLCSKILSSASSLDRHMLVHSGERPFKCKLCDMAFTTNGNMHRHMRTHGEYADPITSNKGMFNMRKREHKRKLSHDDSKNSEELLGVPVEKEKLHCPVCGKSFLCKYGLQSHMETHPNDPILCQNCGEISNNYNLHVNHTCDIASNQNKRNKRCTLTCGFQDLDFMDFTSNKFSLVSKSYCEQNIKRPSSAFHAFECNECSKAFPCTRALKLHQNAHQSKNGTFCPTCDCNFLVPSMLQLHQLKHRRAEHCLLRHDMNKVEEQESALEVTEGKEDFLALFNLQTKESNSEVLKGLKMCTRIKEENFENMDYFVHGKIRNNLVHKSCCNTDTSNNDFADIQSIISLTSKAPLITAVQTSPVSVRPISPLNFVSSQLPESPQIADSPNASPKIPSSDAAVQPAIGKTVPQNSRVESSKSSSPSFQNKIFGKLQNKYQAQKCSKYSCHLCSYISVDKSTLIRHLRTHNGERPFQCTICKYPFTTKANCERHVRKRHKKLTKQEIRNCMQYNPNMALKAMDMASEIGNCETVCKYCNVDFKFNRVLRHHLRSLHNSCNRKPFSCKICSFGFSTKNNCIRHILKQHPHMKDKLRSVVVPNLQKDSHSDVSDKHSDCDIETKLSSDHVEVSIAVCEPAIEQTEPLNLNIESRDEPLNLQTERVNINLVSNDEAVIAAESLVCLSETSPLQDEPLDLVVRPLDLSCKARISALDMCVNKSANIYKNAEEYTTDSCGYLDLTTAGKMVIQPSIMCNQPRNMILTSSPKPAVYLRAPNMDHTFGQKFRAFTCIYCSAGFTLKSNMERHIKRKHPEFARPTRSRNYIPAVIPHKTQRHNINNMLSDRTRDALRHVLCKKVQQPQAHSTHHIPNIYTQKSRLYGHDLTLETSKQKSCSFVPTNNAMAQNNLLQSTSRSDANDIARLSSKESETQLDKSDESVDSIKGPENLDCSTRKSQANLASEVTTDSEKDIGSTGESETSVACPFCARKFPWSSSLRRHILTHTGHKPFKCPLCALWFTTKSNCERHLLRKHGQKGDLISRTVPDRPYKCNHCPTSTFATQGNLRKHFYLKHWTRSCLGMNLKKNDDEPENLDKNLILLPLQDMLNNTKEHSQESENNVKCNFCKESFDDVPHLANHMTEHSHISYMCYLCKKTFTTSEFCKSHFKTSHSLVYFQMEEKEVNINRPASPQIINSNAIGMNEEDNRGEDYVSFMACMFCYRKLSSVDHLLHHMKKHMDTIKVGPDRHNKNMLKKKRGVNLRISKNCVNSTTIHKRGNSKSKVQNSLLYLFNSKQLAGSPSSPKSSEAKNDNSLQEGESDLIQNLLGIQDASMMDELLVSADSAARLLGVKKV